MRIDRSEYSSRKVCVESCSLGEWYGLSGSAIFNARWSNRRWRGSTWTILGRTRRSSVIIGWWSSFSLSLFLRFFSLPLSFFLFLSIVRSLTRFLYGLESWISSLRARLARFHGGTRAWIVIAIRQTDVAINRALILSHSNNRLNNVYVFPTSVNYINNESPLATFWLADLMSKKG